MALDLKHLRLRSRFIAHSWTYYNSSSSPLWDKAMSTLLWGLVYTSFLNVLWYGHEFASAEVDFSGKPKTPPGHDDTVVRPNVLVVVVDDLGWKDVGFHDPSFSTPNIDAMANEGVELLTFYTSATCTPSRAQLMTGRYAYRIGMQDSVVHSTEPRGVPLSETFIGEKLQAAGYQTAAIGKWHLGMHMPQFLPRQRGFDDFFGILTGGGGHYTHKSVSEDFSPRTSVEGTEGMTRTFTGPNIVDGDELSDDSLQTQMHSTELYNTKAAEYINAMAGNGKPWFLYLSYQAIHDPIETDDTWINGRSCATISAENSSSVGASDTDWDNRRIACGMVAQIDNGLGELREKLEDLGEWDNTVVIFFSDNGGQPTHGSINSPFRGGKGDYWEGGVHVPAFLSGGFVASALTRNSVKPYRYGHISHITDVHATVLRLAGFSEEDDTLDGFDLWDSLVETQSPVRKSVVINVNSPNFALSAAVRWSKYKLIRNPEPLETLIYNRVQSKLTDQGMTVSQDILEEATQAVHSQLHLSDPKMYLFDLDANPSETIKDGCGTVESLGPPESCGSVYENPDFEDVRQHLEAILASAERNSVAPTLRWMDDGPLADPLNFGGWVPWRDRQGDPLATYRGVEFTVAAPGKSTPGSTKRQVLQTQSLMGMGSDSLNDAEEGAYSVTVTASRASALALCAAVIAVATTLVAYRAGQRSGYGPLR